VFGGLAASGGIDPAVVTHQSAGIVTESLGDLVDAVPTVEQAGGVQMTDLVRPDRTDAGASRQLVKPWLNRPVRLSGRSGRCDR
jgi:hypothetical protein